NLALEPTPNSLCSSLAPALGRGSPRALAALASGVTMTISWEHTFRHRMRSFEAHRSPQPGEVAVSLKVRVVSGCFHREHSPHAYAIIDQKLLAIPVADREFVFEEHESGPEILVYLAVITAGTTLAKSVIDLVTTIIKARAESVKKGDRPSDPIELIIR